ncbi:MAG: hypothetical protein ACT4O2_05315 [Beijerinckiaceae bacterium]
MTWFGMVANGTALTFPFSTIVSPGLRKKNHWVAAFVLERKITGQLPLGAELFRRRQTSDVRQDRRPAFDFCRLLSFPYLAFSRLQKASRTPRRRKFPWYVGLEVTGGEHPPKAQGSAPQADHWLWPMIRTDPHDPDLHQRQGRSSE